MIEFKNITLEVHAQRLLNQANLHVLKGDKVVLQGASGCGKSSLLKCAIGALSYQSGSIHVLGTELSVTTVRQVRSQVAFVGQEPIMGADTVHDALLLPFTFKAHKHDMPADAAILETVESLNLDASILEKPCSRISGGEKQRVAIARALLLKKRTFIVDEITSALDAASKALVIEALFKPDITVLSVSHDPDWIQACDRMVAFANQTLTEGAE